MSGPHGKQNGSGSRRLRGRHHRQEPAGDVVAAGRVRVRLLQVVGGISALVVLATMIVLGTPPFSTAPAGAASETKLPKSELAIVYQQGFGDSGDIPMPDCGSWNIEGRRGAARWTITSSLGSGSKVFPGAEWEITAALYNDNLDYSPWLYNDGPDPLILQMVPTGPIERVQMTPTLPANLGIHDVYGGDDPVGLKGTIQQWGYAYDSNSKPKLDGLHQETSDGVDLTLKIKVRATQAGTITLPKLAISGWDSTPKAASIGCDVPLNWSWDVVKMDKPNVQGETVSTDATYVAATDDDANGGGHSISIDVLKNDDDANTSDGGLGNTDEVRIADHQLNTDAGGMVSCGLGLIQTKPEPENFTKLPTGPCIYTPPGDYSGPDSFDYTVRQNSDQSEAKGTVKITVVGNAAPATIPALFHATAGNDDDFDVQGWTGDPKGEATTCMTDLVSDPTPDLGTVTMNADCSFHWDSTAPGNGAVEFGYRVCDTHPLLANHGLNATKVPGYTSGLPSDLSATTSRRCADGTAKIVISQGFVIEPTGVTDLEVVDAGYAAEDIGFYTVAIPVLDNDFDNNGPTPTHLEILDGPDATEGVAHVIGQRVFFRPADGFAGPVQFTYRLCEDPEAQDPPYQGLPFCGVGQVIVDVIPNAAPALVDDEAELFATETVDDLDLGFNDVEPDGEGMACTTTPVSVSDPAKVASLSISSDCLLDLDPVDDATGTIEVAYQACDDHVLSTPADPAPLYGSDDRQPGDVAPRCSTAIATLTILEEVTGEDEPAPEIDPGPTDEDPEPGDPDPADPDPTDPDQTTTTTSSTVPGSTTSTVPGPTTTVPGSGDGSGSGSGDGDGRGRRLDDRSQRHPPGDRLERPGRRRARHPPGRRRPPGPRGEEAPHLT